MKIIYQLKKILNITEYYCKKILLKYNKISKEFEYYTTDWYMQHKLYEFPQFKSHYIPLGLKCLKDEKYININNLQTSKDTILYELD